VVEVAELDLPTVGVQWQEVVAVQEVEVIQIQLEATQPQAQVLVVGVVV
tara:strand:+ start:237 stop:383 length:147 start_codon:yes stop_codon:yes gene_type:complete